MCFEGHSEPDLARAHVVLELFTGLQGSSVADSNLPGHGLDPSETSVESRSDQTGSWAGRFSSCSLPLVGTCAGWMLDWKDSGKNVA